VGRSLAVVLLRLLLLLAVGACSVGEEARPDRVDRIFPANVALAEMSSGSRLRLRTWKIGGASILRDFVDLQRGGQPCGFVEDGLWRTGPGPTYFCLPLGLARHDLDLGPYADKDCTKPLGIAPIDEKVATHVIFRAVDACGAPPMMYTAGPVSTIVPYFLDGVLCTRSSVRIRVQEPEVPASLAEFATASERTEDRRDDRIAALVLSSIDGARLTVGGFDKLRSEPVRIDEQPRAELRWIPSRVAFQGAGEVLFGSPTCETSSAIPTKIARDAICPLTSVVVFTDSCGGTKYRELGERTKGETNLFQIGPTTNQCGPVSRTASVFTFSGGAPIDDSIAFAPARSVDIGNDIVFRRAYSGLSGNIATWGDLYDRRTNQACSVTGAVDGTMRCLPKASATIDLFADPACTRSAFVSPRFTCSPESVQSKFVRAKFDDEEGSRVFEVVSQIPSVYQFDLTTSECTPVKSDIPTDAYEAIEADIALFPLALAN
jgi:hypothetical protein